MAAANTSTEKGSKLDPEAIAKNWEQRIRSEQEAPHIWAESWGELFVGDLPHEYSERIKFLEGKLKGLPPMKPIPKYGVGQPFKEVGVRDNRRKKLFNEGTFGDDV